MYLRLGLSRSHLTVYKLKPPVREPGIYIKITARVAPSYTTYTTLHRGRSSVTAQSIKLPRRRGHRSARSRASLRVPQHNAIVQTPRAADATPD